MATLTIRKLDDAAYERLKTRAKANKRSLEAEARTLIEEASGDPSDIVAMLRESHERYVAEHGYWDGDSTDLIRKIREEE